MVLQLCIHVANLEVLIQNQSLMSLLSRLLDSDHKTSLEMCYNIVRIFLSFSNFIEMHHLLGQYKVSLPAPEVAPATVGVFSVGLDAKIRPVTFSPLLLLLCLLFFISSYLLLLLLLVRSVPSR